MDENEKDSGKQEAKPIVLEISLHPDGQLSVKCPMLRDKMFMLGLLEIAKVTVLQYGVQETPIIKPHVSLLNRVRSQFK